VNRRLLAGAAVVAALTWIAGSAPLPISASPAAPHAAACGHRAPSNEVVAPPDVEVWKLPVNAGGEHELILAVHRDGDRFCYSYTWNGATQTVSPAIRVRRGDHFALRIVNDLSGQSRGEYVSSTVIPSCMPMPMPPARTVHYVGYLNHTIDDRHMHVRPVDTNIHLHGFEGPADEENIFLSTLSTPMHACEYHITIPRTQPPGLYMYHTHSHGASDDQVAGGLDGAWIVEPDQPQLPRSAEHVIILRYRLPFELDNNFAPDETAIYTDAVAHEAALPNASPVPYDPFDPPPWPVTLPMRAGGVTLDPSGCNGLISDTVLAVDGADVPATLAVPAGRPQLLRILNGTSDSATRLKLRDSSGRVQSLHIVGLDGVPVSGDMEHPLAGYIPMNDVLLTSMSRADILLTAEPGATYTLSTEHYCMGKDGFFEMHHDLLRITAVPGSGSSSMTFSSKPVDVANTPAAKLVAFARAHPSLVRRRAFTFTEYLFPKNGKIPPRAAYFITETTNPNFHEHSFWPVYRTGATVPYNADVVVKKGSVEEWYLVNATMESHAFHIHQMTFVQETSPAGIPLTVDTVFVPIGTLLPNKKDPNYPLVKPRITKILLDFRNVPRGTFVFHCHMLFHEDRGMMAIVRVV
jgi:FtsP/CotA-like multicopper oxidase with cupredoxin domain